MPEDVERLLGRSVDLEALAGAAVRDGDEQPVGVPAPEERDLDSVRGAVVELGEGEAHVHECLRHRAWRPRSTPPKRGTAVPLFVWEVDPQKGQHDEQPDERRRSGRDQDRVTAATQRIPAGAPPEDHEAGDGADTDHQHGCEQRGALERKIGQPDRQHDERGHGHRSAQQPGAHRGTGYARCVVEANYVSGDDYVIEFQDHRFGFNASDFEQRVTAAAVKLGLVADNELDEDETADLVELVWRDWIEEPRSGLGRYLVRHWERVSLVGGESLVYWPKKLVFRSAWLDHRVKEGILDVAWDEELADFAYRDPNGDRALLELAPVPSWHELQFRR